METQYVINSKTKTVVYQGTSRQCKAIVKKYPQRRYTIALMGQIPGNYVYTYQLNFLENPQAKITPIYR